MCSLGRTCLYLYGTFRFVRDQNKRIRAPNQQYREFMKIGLSKDKEFRPRSHNSGRGPEFCSLGRNCLYLYGTLRFVRDQNKRIRAPNRQDSEFMKIGSSRDKELRPRPHSSCRGPECCSLVRNCLVDGSTHFRTFQTLLISGPQID